MYAKREKKQQLSTQSYLKGLPRLVDCIPIVGHLQDVAGHVLARHVPRAKVHKTRFQARPDSFSLADGVEPQAAVLSDVLAGLAVDDGPRCLSEVMPQKVVEL